MLRLTRGEGSYYWGEESFSSVWWGNLENVRERRVLLKEGLGFIVKQKGAIQGLQVFTHAYLEIKKSSFKRLLLSRN